MPGHLPADGWEGKQESMDSPDLECGVQCMGEAAGGLVGLQLIEIKGQHANCQPG